MLRLVALVRTDVSEEVTDSIIRVRRIGELGTTLSGSAENVVPLGMELGTSVSAAR
jgi:hypothetical protein